MRELMLADTYPAGARALVAKWDASRMTRALVEVEVLEWAPSGCFVLLRTRGGDEGWQEPPMVEERLPECGHKQRRVMTMEKLLTVKEAAAQLGLSEWAIYTHCSAGHLPHIRLGRSVRIPANALAEWIKAEAMKNAQNSGITLASGTAACASV